MAEPYKKVGRGGAGNFYSKKDIQVITKAKAIDGESNPVPTADLARALSASQPPSEFQHTGRGGAGNWVKPAELETQGLAQPTSPDPTSTTPTTSPLASTNGNGVALSKRVLGGSKPTYRGGRGGAGNYTDYEAEEKARKEEEERRRRDMENRVERDVEAGLARPPKAYGGIGGAWELADMK